MHRWSSSNSTIAGREELNLNGVRLDGGIQFTFPDLVLPAGETIVVAEDLAALLAEYGSGVHAVGQYNGNLNNSSDEIVLQLPAPYDAAILRFTYDATWYPATNGGGRALEIVDPNLPFTAWSNQNSWKAGSVTGGTPGYQIGLLPPADDIVVNEVLSHTDPPLQDAIELHNTGAQTVDLGGWFLSDSRQNPNHYRIPDGNSIAGGGYLVFTEEQFNPSGGTDSKTSHWTELTEIRSGFGNPPPPANRHILSIESSLARRLTENRSVAIRTVWAS